MTRAERRRRKVVLNRKGRNKFYGSGREDSWNVKRAALLAAPPPENITPAVRPRRTPTTGEPLNTSRLLPPSPTVRGISTPFDGFWGQVPDKAIHFGR
jgi:hypothetical protein